jgi:hypothetical protein
MVYALTTAGLIAILERRTNMELPLNPFIEGSEHFKPTLLRTLSGGWLAVWRGEPPLPIGVAAATEEEARGKFDLAVKAWHRLWTDEQETE